MDKKTMSITVERFTELIATEERLKLLEKAILGLSYNSQVEDIKDIFGIKKPESEGDKTDE